MPKVLVSLDKLKDPHSGLGQFSLDLGRSLIEESAPGLDLKFLLPRRRRRWFSGTGVSLLNVNPSRKEILRRMIRPLVPAAVRGLRAVDVWHAPHQDAKYLPFDPRVPVVLTIHDLNYLRERTPGEIPGNTRALQRKVDRAAVITTISEFSAKEIADHLSLDGKPVHVIHHGLSGSSGASERPPGVPDGDFLFAIGHVVARKNMAVLVPMMAQLPDYRLLIAGRRSGAYCRALEAAIREAGLRDRVVLLGEVSDGARNWLYRHAAALLVPSLTEGFGLPVLEAMREGKPVFMSRATSLPEVGGSLGFYWDSYSPEHMVEVFRTGMEAFGSDRAYGDKLRTHAARYSWAAAAKAYVDIYLALAG